MRGQAPQRIHALRPNVSQAEAERALAHGPIGRVILGPLRAVAQAFVPYRLFHLTAEGGPNRRTDRILALDAACGRFDPYGFAAAPGPEALAEFESGNVVPSLVDDARLEALAEDKLRRLIFARGFFRVRRLAITVRPIGAIHVPYWLGFSGHGEEAHLAVLDAVRRRREGAKAREFFSSWLAG